MEVISNVSNVFLGCFLITLVSSSWQELFNELMSQWNSIQCQRQNLFQLSYANHIKHVICLVGCFSSFPPSRFKRNVFQMSSLWWVPRINLERKILGKPFLVGRALFLLDFFGLGCFTILCPKHKQTQRFLRWFWKLFSIIIQSKLFNLITHHLFRER